MKTVHLRREAYTDKPFTSILRPRWFEVRFASHPIAANSANDPYSLPAYQVVADYLIEQN